MGNYISDELMKELDKALGFIISQGIDETQEYPLLDKLVMDWLTLNNKL